MTMRLIDSHCHLAHSRLAPQVEPILQRARLAGVVACVLASGDLAEAAASQKLCRQFASHADVPRLCFTAGLHPHEAKDAPGDLVEHLEALCRDEQCVAVGEIGLDYHYDFSPRDAQRAVFARQLELAHRLGRKVVIHTREAFGDTIAIIRECGIDGRRLVFHSCTQERADVEQMLDLGASVGFSGIVTFRNAQHLRDAAAIVPADRILVETDSPYLSPEPVRSMRNNEPANVAHTAAALARLRSQPLDSFAAQTTQNAAAFFGIDLPPAQRAADL